MVSLPAPAAAREDGRARSDTGPETDLVAGSGPCLAPALSSPSPCPNAGAERVWQSTSSIAYANFVRGLAVDARAFGAAIDFVDCLRERRSTSSIACPNFVRGRR